jgi:hypothetical protein
VENTSISLFARSSRLEGSSIRHLYLALHNKTVELSILIRPFWRSLKQCANMLAYHHLSGKMLSRPLSISITDNLCVDSTGPPPYSYGMVKNQTYLISRSLGLKPTSSFLRRNDNTNYLRKQKRLSLSGMKKEPKATSFGLQSEDMLSSLPPPLSTSLPFLSIPKREKTNHPQYLFHIPAIMFRSPPTYQIIRTRLCRTESRKTFRLCITINLHHRKINTPINSYHKRMVMMSNSNLDQQLLNPISNLHHLIVHLLNHLAMSKNLDVV